MPPVVGDIRRESLDTLRVRHRSEEGDAKVERDSPRGNFVELFRGCAPYIRAHLGAVMVVHMGGEVLDDPGFVSLMDDLGLLSLLGVSGRTCNLVIRHVVAAAMILRCLLLLLTLLPLFFMVGDVCVLLRGCDVRCGLFL